MKSNKNSAQESMCLSYRHKRRRFMNRNNRKPMVLTRCSSHPHSTRKDTTESFDVNDVTRLKRTHFITIAFAYWTTLPIIGNAFNTANKSMLNSKRLYISQNRIVLIGTQRTEHHRLPNLLQKWNMQNHEIQYQHTIRQTHSLIHPYQHHPRNQFLYQQTFIQMVVGSSFFFGTFKAIEETSK